MNVWSGHALVFCASFFVLSPVLQGCATSSLEVTPPVRSYERSVAQAAKTDQGSHGTLKVLTLNVAHGRGESFHQLLQGTDATTQNLDAIASVLRDSGADIVALQEADGPSFWSGNFDHIDYLAENGAFYHSVRGAHADGMGLSYGTALLSNLGLSEPTAVTFDTVLSPVPKGFVVSTIGWPGNPALEIDVVSVHLDFASQIIRQRQARELVAALRDRKRPVIIMGDFNTEWGGDSAVHYVSETLDLSAHRPQAEGLETFPAFGERLDWILVSKGIRFHSYDVIPHKLSDHLGVIAELEWYVDQQNSASCCPVNRASDRAGVDIRRQAFAEP